jgi:flagellar protein FliS
MLTARYVENEVLSADPLGLVRLLYAGALDAVGQAREHLAAGRIRERSHSINRAMQIVAELQGSLDPERGGAIAQSLAELYAFVQGRLIQANARQDAPALDDAARILSTLYEGWKQISGGSAAPTLCQPGFLGATSPAWTL